jgi:hypothetical protein
MYIDIDIYRYRLLMVNHLYLLCRRVPNELGAQFGQKVDIAIEHRIEKDYDEPVKKCTMTFTGEGYRLGK